MSMTGYMNARAYVTRSNHTRFTFTRSPTGMAPIAAEETSSCAQEKVISPLLSLTAQCLVRRRVQLRLLHQRISWRKEKGASLLLFFLDFLPTTLHGASSLGPAPASDPSRCLFLLGEFLDKLSLPLRMRPAG